MFIYVKKKIEKRTKQKPIQYTEKYINTKHYHFTKIMGEEAPGLHFIQIYIAYICTLPTKATFLTA
jgi:hypothetical protein